jgi:hypothetical protein
MQCKLVLVEIGELVHQEVLLVEEQVELLRILVYQLLQLVVEEDHFIIFKMLTQEDLVVEVQHKTEVNQDQEYLEHLEHLVKDMLAETAQAELQTMAVVAVAVPEQLDQMELLPPEVQVVFVFKFPQHLGIQVHQ